MSTSSSKILEDQPATSSPEVHRVQPIAEKSKCVSASCPLLFIAPSYLIVACGTLFPFNFFGCVSVYLCGFHNSCMMSSGYGACFMFTQYLHGVLIFSELGECISYIRKKLNHTVLSPLYQFICVLKITCTTVFCLVLFTYLNMYIYSS